MAKARPSPSLQGASSSALSPTRPQTAPPTATPVLNLGATANLNVHSPTPFRQKQINGNIYTLNHLSSFDFQISTSTGTKVVYVEFSCHCFTEDFTPSHSPGLKYTHKGETRAFCVNRHALSQHLQAIIIQLGSRSVHHTTQGTFFTLKMNLPGAGTAPYLVFFSTAKSTKTGVDVLMSIKSAYPKPNMTQRASPVKFTTLVEATAGGKRWW